MVAVAPSRFTTPRKNSRQTAPNTTPAIIAEKKPVVAMRRAESTSPLPSAREIKLPEPCPNVKPSAWMMLISGNTTPTAAVADVPMRPTKNVSAML